ncbi:MAG: tetratricopeptide repeat protein, partial [Chloroflexi bacterium]|nr:tetratricopeptide repeat protein [Chloroflexota bacterium]
GAWDDLGEKRQALAYYEQALPLYRAVGDRGGEATTLNNIGKVWADLGEKRKALAYYEQALPLYRAVGDRGGEAATCFNIGMIYRDFGDLDRAIQYLERCVELDEQVEHPDLESDRRVLAQLKRQRDGGGELTEEEQAIQVMQMLAQVYREQGAEAVRQMLRRQIPDEVIEQLLAQLASDSPLPDADAEGTGVRASSPSTLPDETVRLLAQNTAAVKTGAPDKLDDWRATLQNLHADFAGRGDDWAIEVAFAAALLAVLDDQPAALPDDNPYAPVVRAVVAAIAEFRRGGG